MTKDEARTWFLEIAKPRIENNMGLFCTYYYVYEDNNGYGNYDPYSFTIGYQGYNCSVDCDNCDDCPYRTSHGDCGEYSLYINEDGSIYYGGSEKTYSESDFEEFLGEFY